MKERMHLTLSVSKVLFERLNKEVKKKKLQDDYMSRSNFVRQLIKNYFDKIDKM